MIILAVIIAKNIQGIIDEMFRDIILLIVTENIMYVKLFHVSDLKGEVII